ncbi:MAG: hypothetical protein ABR548_13060 [Actinomycetota bacterium]|nr:hypothetical protein [Actinomycetota bacterium]
MPVAGHAAPAKFYVGVGERDISPTASEIATDNFFLGGYGFGSGRIGTQDHYVTDPTGVTEDAIEARTAVGVMGKNDDGTDLVPNNPFAPWVRAFAISDGTHTIVLADFDNQGTFASYKPNYSTGALRPFAIDDIRAAAAAARPELDARSIVLSSDHSHAGQDLTGVWGFVPDAYLARVKTLAVDAILEAYDSMQPAVLKESSIETPQACGPDAGSPTRVFNNQFCGGSVVGAVDPNRDHANDYIDAQVRVLRAFPYDTPNGTPFAILVNAAIHATVGGGGNRFVSSDWVSTMSSYLERDNPGAKAVTIVGDVGRTQPNRDSCNPANPTTFIEPLTGEAVPYDKDRRANDSCNISQFARRVQAWVNKAVADSEQPVIATGVDYRELFIRDPSDSAILFGANYALDAAGIPIVRGITPPYLNGTVLGTWVGAYKVGDILMVSAPGEAYPSIRLGVINAVSTTKPVWIFGLANDQLGYFIAPTPDAYPEPIRQSALDGDPQEPIRTDPVQQDTTTWQDAVQQWLEDPNEDVPIVQWDTSIEDWVADPSENLPILQWGADPVGNDNFFFNVSQTIGDHVMCTMIKGALQLGFGTTLDVATAAPKCAPWSAEVNESGPGDPTWSPL